MITIKIHRRKEFSYCNNSILFQIIEFLEKAEQAGKGIQTVMGPNFDVGSAAPDPNTHNVSYEARQLKTLFLKLSD